MAERITWRVCVLLGAVAVCAGANWGQAKVFALSIRIPSSTAANVMPLVNVDYEMGEWIAKGRDAMEKKEWGRAIEILQAMIEKKDGGFFAVEGNKRQYVPLRREATKLLGELGPVGLAQYRRLYDPKAKRKYTDAIAAGDIRALRVVVEQYRWTPWGDRALETMGQWNFDAGRFDRAAREWELCLARREEAAKALLPRPAKAVKGKLDSPEAAPTETPKTPKPVETPPKPVAPPVAAPTETPKTPKPVAPPVAASATAAAVPAAKKLSREERQARAVLYVKIATAWHLAGEPRQAAKWKARLASGAPGMKATLGGESRDLQAYLQTLCSLTPPAAVSTVTAMGERYPGFGGVGDGIATMADVKGVVLLPRWRSPGVAAGDEGMLDMISESVQKAIMGAVVAPHAHRGEVRFKPGKRYGSNKPHEFLPPILQPVVADGKVIYRDDKDVVALDLETGLEAWRASGVTLYRPLTNSPNNNQVLILKDFGRYGLTVGGDRIFTCYHYAPVSNYAYFGGSRKAPLKPSRLRALSISKEGKALWEVGAGLKHSDEFLQACEFISLPTYLAAQAHSPARLYGVVKKGENYHLVCLNAETGELRWKRQIAQAPANTNRSRGQINACGTPPALADGRVIVATNTGVVSAFDIDTGQPLWAHQYPHVAPNNSPLQQAVQLTSLGSGQSNPIVIAGSSVVVLPADSMNVLGLSLEDGLLEWETPRGGAIYLTGLDHERVLLGGRGFRVASAANGATLFYTNIIPRLAGRPVVTPTSILINGNGGLYRIARDSYTVASVGRIGAGGLLGNLISVPGRLIAANTMGICIYKDYDDAYALLAPKPTLAASVRVEALIERGMLSMTARRYSRAVADLEKANTLAKTLKDPEQTKSLAQQIRPRLYSAYVSLGNLSKGETMFRRFQQAEGVAQSDREKARMLLRYMRYHEKRGDFTDAITLAHTLLRKYGTLDLVNVQIGPRAMDRSDSLESAETHLASKLADTFIRRLLKTHGHRIYQAIDEKATAALLAARKADDPEAMEEVAARWPYSEARADALFEAARSYYRLSARTPKPTGQEYFHDALRLLTQIAGDAKSPHHPSAAFSLLTYYLSSGRRGSAEVLYPDLEAMPEETPIAFGAIKGTLGDLLEGAEEKPIVFDRVGLEYTPAIAPPLREVFRLAYPGGRLCRDAQGEAISLGRDLLLKRNGGVARLRPAADTASKAIVWQATIEIKDLGVIGLMRKGEIVVLAGTNGAVALNSKTGKRLWALTYRAHFSGAPARVLLGQDILVAVDSQSKLWAFDATSGQFQWENRLPVSAGPRGAKRQLGAICFGKNQLLVSSVMNGVGHFQVFNSKNGKLRVSESVKGKTLPQIRRLRDQSRLLLLGGALTRDYPLRKGEAKSREVSAQVGAKTILVASTEFVVLQDPAQPGQLATLAGKTLTPVSTLKVGPVSPEAVVRCRGGLLYILDKGTLRCYRLASGKEAWQWASAAGAEGSSMWIGQSHVVVLANAKARGEAAVTILRCADGTQVQTLPFHAPKAAEATGQAAVNAAWTGLGGATITPGRLIVETPAGVAVFGSGD